MGNLQELPVLAKSQTGYQEKKSDRRSWSLVVRYEKA